MHTMNVMIGHFSSESNENARSLMSFDKFIFRYGEQLIETMGVGDLFAERGIGLVPSIYASGHPHGPVTADAFEFIRSRMIRTVEDHLREIDGIFLFLHGASKIIGLAGGSGEHEIVRELRRIVGPYVPIALVMDPHGNLSQTLVDEVSIIRCFRESPHTDALETRRFVARALIDLLEQRRDIHPVYLRVPMILGGEKSVSSDEPMRSINRMCDEVEATGQVISASFHIGYLRHDGDKLGCSVVVVPRSEADRGFALRQARRIRDFAFARRRDFRYHGNVAEPVEALAQVATFNDGPCFLTDSGDNCGSGADGFNTGVLRQVLALADTRGKRFLFAGIVDRKAHAQLIGTEIGEAVEFDLGADVDELSRPVRIRGHVTARGLGHAAYAQKRDIGTVITVQLDDAPVSVVVEADAIQYTDLDQFACSDLCAEDYDVIIVKEGYISDDFERYGKLCVMSLTQGPTYQKTEGLVFRRIHRPMFPYDDFELQDVGIE